MCQTKEKRGKDRQFIVLTDIIIFLREELEILSVHSYKLTRLLGSVWVIFLTPAV